VISYSIDKKNLKARSRQGHLCAVLGLDIKKSRKLGIFFVIAGLNLILTINIYAQTSFSAF
jgi:hypothetical protein